MAGKHIAGSSSLGFLIDGDLPSEGNPPTQHFMLKNDSAYSDGRGAAFRSEAQNTNPFGALEADAIKINQQDAWLCWDWGWTLNGAGGGSDPTFQYETCWPVRQA